MALNDRFLDRVAAAAVNPQPQMVPPQQPQQAQGVVQIDLVGFVQTGIITPEQAFNMIFKQQAPAEFAGRKVSN